MAITRIGIATSATTTITPPSEAKAGDAAILVVTRTNTSSITPTGWTPIATRTDNSDRFQGVFTRVLTGGDLGVPLSTDAPTNRMEVWRGVLSVTAPSSFTTPTSGTRAMPAMAAVPGSVGIWVSLADRYFSAFGATPPTPPAGIMGGTNEAVTTFFGSPITGAEIPAASFIGAGGASNNFAMLGLVLAPAAPAHNMFRIDASGETGLTPYLLGASSAGDTTLRWEP